MTTQNNTPVTLTPHNGGYSKRLYAGHHHKTPVKINVPDNVSYFIYGNPKTRGWIARKPKRKLWLRQLRASLTSKGSGKSSS